MGEGLSEKIPVQIVSATTEGPHRHVVSVGVGGIAASPNVSMTVEEVAYAIMGGQEFYTEVHGVKSIVHRITCTATGCRVKTISSIEDDTVTNDLDNLPAPGARVTTPAMPEGRPS